MSELLRSLTGERLYGIRQRAGHENLEKWLRDIQPRAKQCELTPIFLETVARIIGGY